MRLWSIHPRYLDWRGLIALWRESLLAQKVLAGETSGWRKHPQLDRFKYHPEPMDAIGFYLLKIKEEADCRGYSYDGSRIKRPTQNVAAIQITMGQLRYEFSLLLERVHNRTPTFYNKLIKTEFPPAAHPIFEVVEGDVGQWEVSYWREGSTSKGKTDSHHAASPNSLASS